MRLDIYATDSENKKYNIEIQRADKGAGAKRARYNSSLIDSNILPTGFEVENLAETYVIFITENDVIGKNKPIYHIERYRGAPQEPSVLEVFHPLYRRSGSRGLPSSGNA